MRLIIHVFLLLFLFLCLSSCDRTQPGISAAMHVSTEANGQTDAQPTIIKTKDLELSVPAGYNVHVSTAHAKQPLPPDQPAVAAADKSNARGDSGSAGKTPESWGLDGTLMFGAGLCILGLLIFLSKSTGIIGVVATGPAAFLARFADALPKGSGVGLMIIGGALIILPWFLDTVRPLVPWAAGGAVLILCVWWIYNIIQAEKKEFVEELKEGQTHGPT